MRIINQPIPGITKAYKQMSKENNIVKSNSSAQQDKLNISHEARFFHLAKSALKQLPEDKKPDLQEIKMSIKSGTYEVNNNELVEKIYQESIFDKCF